MLQPYHDVAGIVTNLVKSVIEPTFDSSEGLVWNVTLGRGEAGLQGEGFGVWGIVHKSNLRSVKQQRWDLVSGFCVTRARLTSVLPQDPRERLGPVHPHAVHRALGRHGRADQDAQRRCD